MLTVGASSSISRTLRQTEQGPRVMLRGSASSPRLAGLVSHHLVVDQRVATFEESAWCGVAIDDARRVLIVGQGVESQRRACLDCDHCIENSSLPRRSTLPHTHSLVDPSLAACPGRHSTFNFAGARFAGRLAVIIEVQSKPYMNRLVRQNEPGELRQSRFCV